MPRTTNAGKGQKPGQNLIQNDPAEQMAEQQRQRIAVQAVLRGMTYDQAAKAAGYHDRSGAYKAVQRVLARGAQEIQKDGDKLRALEVARLDRMLVELADMAYGQTNVEIKLKALEAMRRNVETRAKLLNLYAPMQVEVFSRDQLDLQIATIAAKLGLPVPERVQLQLGPAIAGTVVDAQGAATA